MSLTRPTLDELRERSKGQMQTRLGTGPFLKRSVLGVLGDVLAAHAHGLYGYLEWTARQGLPTTADTDGVEQWATTFGIARKPATFARGAVTATGVDGIVIPMRKRIRRPDGVEFQTTSPATILGGTAAVPVQALVAGEVGNTVAGGLLTLTAPVAGASSTLTVTASGLTGGDDAETTEGLRERVLQRARQLPGAGNAADFVRWALEVGGVTRAWCFPRFPAIGSVGVAFATDDEPTGPIPSPAKVAEVFAHLDVLRPVSAQLLVFAPAPLPVSISVILTPNTADVRDAIAAELADLFRRQAAPAQTLYVSHIREAISAAAGEVDHVLLSPVTDVVPGKGQLPVLGSIFVQ